MKNLKKLIFSVVLIYVVSTAFALADHKSGHAHVYKVTMRKVELCTASSPNKDNMTNAATCSNPVVIGSGDRVVDIAGVGAGSVAASYGDPALFPLGETLAEVALTPSAVESEKAIDPEPIETKSPPELVTENNRQDADEERITDEPIAVTPKPEIKLSEDISKPASAPSSAASSIRSSQRERFEEESRLELKEDPCRCFHLFLPLE